MKRGVNLHPIWTAVDGIPQLIQTLTSIGAESVRIDAPWTTLEPTTKGTYDETHLERLDAFVSQCDTAGIPVLMVPAYTPPWANGNQASNIPPSNPQDFADFCGYLAGRFPTLTAMEVWNEPDLNWSWAWGPTGSASYAQRAQGYAQMLALCAPAIRDAVSTIKVVAPVTGGYNIYSQQWLQAFFATNPQANYDLLSCHMYGDPPNHGNVTPANLVSDWVSGMMAVIKAADTTTPIWITESGYNSSPTGVTEAQQATDLKQLWNNLKLHARIKVFHWFELLDGSNLPPTDPESCYGLMNADQTPKPAAATFQTLT